MPPWKPWVSNLVGQYVQDNYSFMDQLFDPVGGAAFRQQFWDYPNEAALRVAINNYLNLNLAHTVRVGFFDVEKPGARFFDPPIKPDEQWYVMVLPPMPRRNAGTAGYDQYVDSQEWEDAWYHAVVDSYGM
jgi:hypothetical protein